MNRYAKRFSDDEPTNIPPLIFFRLHHKYLAANMDKTNSVILATAGYDRKIHFWDPPSGECLRTLRFSDSQVNALTINNFTYPIQERTRSIRN